MHVFLLRFSFDRMEIVEALIGAHLRGCRVRVGADYNMTMHGRTRDQVMCLRKLVASGVEVVLIQGDPLGPVYRAAGRESFGNLKGIQHSKGLLVGNRSFIGSANWTTSTRGNREITVQTLHKKDSEIRMLREAFVQILSSGQPFSGDAVEQAARARTQSPKIGRTQRRFNGARD